MSDADLSAPRSTRMGVFVLVALLHVAALLGLLRAFAPDFTASAVATVASALSVTVVTLPPSPSPSPEKARKPAGAAADAGKKAVPREVVAVKPRVVLTKAAAPPVKSTGSADTSGARDTGQGTGAGGQGSGTGNGSGGQGSGGGVVTKPVKIAGDINAARDYPRAGAEARRDDYVVVYVTVGTDGRARGCRVVRASRDPAADALTCRFAEERFRFRPATDSAGNPVAATYGWKQRWFN